MSVVAPQLTKRYMEAMARHPIKWTRRSVPVYDTPKTSPIEYLRTLVTPLHIPVSRTFATPLCFSLSQHFLGICSLYELFLFHSFHMTSLCQPTPHLYLLKTFLHSNLHPRFIHSSLAMYLNRLLSFLCWCHRPIVYRPLMYAGVTHELSIFPSRLRDMYHPLLLELSCSRLPLL